MRERDFFLNLANQKKSVEFAQCWINRTVAYSNGLCMMLACGFIWRNARHKGGATGPKKLKGMTARDLTNLQKYFKLIDKESFRTAVGNRFGAAPPQLLDTHSPTFNDDIVAFKNAADEQPEAIQEKHLLVRQLTNAVERHIDEFPDPTNVNAKLGAVRNMIENMSALKLKMGVVQSDGTSDEFYYVSDNGHGWAFAVRRTDQKFKLFDPNHGIITFETADHLLQAADVYAEQGAYRLRFT